MRIAYLAAGAAGMYCGSCLHDNALATALLAMGEEVVLAPIYTPLRTDERDVSVDRVFIGGVNAYLQQKFAFFRHLPRWVDGWLDQPWLLRLATRGAASVEPAKLGGMTVSMLKGELGNQRKELDKLVDWLLAEVRPDVVHLSNAMMLGLARKIEQRCGPPVVCSLSGEDIFLEKLLPPYYDQARQLLRERAAEVPAFTALNDYYASAMAEYLAVPRSRIHVIPHGVRLEGFDAQVASPPSVPLRIGYLARICEDKGLHLLVDACALLARRTDLPHFEVHAAGYLGKAERPYLRRVLRAVAAGPLARRFFYHGEVDRPGKAAFLASLAVMSTPTLYRESKGLPVVEAWAMGRPVVVPRHGAFPEMVTATGGGLLHKPGDSADLAAQLAELLSSPERRDSLGAAGRHAVATRLHATRMADETLALYQRLTSVEAE